MEIFFKWDAEHSTVAERVKESHHTSLHCSRDAKVLYMLYITTKCVKPTVTS